MLKHTLMGGKLHLYKRAGSRYWQCSAYVAGKNRRMSTKEESLAHAKEIAEDWFFELKGKKRAGLLKDGKTFRDATNQLLKEYPVIVAGKRNPDYIDSYEMALRVHILPFFGDRPLDEITAGTVQEFRVHRIENSRTGKPPSHSAMEHDITVIRQSLRTAVRHGWLHSMPDLSQPYKTVGKVGHRAWFSPEEYKQLYTATRRRAHSPKKEQWRHECEDLHDWVLFMVNTGLRPDECWNLQDRDAAIIADEDSGETIVLIEVRGKRGVGYCKSMPGAVLPLQRIRKRNRPRPEQLLFPNRHRELFNAILREEGLKFDRDGQPRTAYSLRHSYICFRLMERADIYQVAKNCRTSVEMIQKHYARHLTNTLDAGAINVRRKKPNAVPADSRSHSAGRPKRKGARHRTRHQRTKGLANPAATAMT